MSLFRSAIRVASLGTKDFDIPPAAMRFMADRALARKTVIVPGASHVVTISQPHAVAALVEEAASGPAVR